MLAVGDSARLEIIFSTKSYRRYIQKAPKLTTNEGPEDAVVRIGTMVCSNPGAEYPLLLAPHKLNLSRFSDSLDVLQGEIVITNRLNHSVFLEMIACPSELMQVNLPANLKPGQSDTIFVNLLGSAPEWSFEKSFTFELSDAARSRITVPVTRAVRVGSPHQTGFVNDCGRR
ncbi:MAG: hypothetical protein ABIE70_10250 [bacterium]